jgi:hypothetical protein
MKKSSFHKVLALADVSTKGKSLQRVLKRSERFILDFVLNYI